jgi:hypothetical protein
MFWHETRARERMRREYLEVRSRLSFLEKKLDVDVEVVHNDETNGLLVQFKDKKKRPVF